MIKSFFGHRGSFYLASLALTILMAGLAPRVMSFLPATLSLFYLYYLYIDKKSSIVKPDTAKFLLPCAGLLLLIGFSVLFSMDPVASATEALGSAGVIIGGIVIMTALLSIPPETVRNCGWILIPSLISLFSILSVHWATDFQSYRMLNHVPQGNGVDPFVLNKSTGIATLLLIPSLCLLFRSSLPLRNKKILALAMTVIFLPLLYISWSQSCQLAVIVMAAMFFLFPATHRTALRLLGVFAMVIVTSFPLIAMHMFAHFKALGLPAEKLNSAAIAQRLEIWDFISRRVMESPLVGFGYEATKMIKDFDAEKLYYDSNTVLHPHNALLQIWIESGMVGALFVCAIIFLVMRLIEEITDPLIKKAGLAMFTGLATISLTSWGLWQGWWLGSILFAISLFVIAARQSRHQATIHS